MLPVPAIRSQAQVSPRPPSGRRLLDTALARPAPPARPPPRTQAADLSAIYGVPAHRGTDGPTPRAPLRFSRRAATSPPGHRTGRDTAAPSPPRAPPPPPVPTPCGVGGPPVPP